LPGYFEAPRLRAVTDHHGDFGVEVSGGHAVGDSFKIGTATGEQNAEALFHL
jgi:hypothetical protein